MFCLPAYQTQRKMGVAMDKVGVEHGRFVDREYAEDVAAEFVRDGVDAWVSFCPKDRRWIVFRAPGKEVQL